MPDLLLELLTEEIPARMQAMAERELASGAERRLRGAGLDFLTIDTCSTPRRLVLSIAGLPTVQRTTREERRGPREGAPQAAIDGFVKSSGVPLDRCELRDTGKGKFYFATIERTGLPTEMALIPLLRELVLDLPWPKSMRFPAADFRWVRPLTSVVALFDNAILGLPLGDGVPVGAETVGHRFLSSGPITVTGFADYKAKIRAASVMLERREREAEIFTQLEARLHEHGLRWRTDDALLDEVVGLVEWPVVKVGAIEPRFMALPPEVLTTVMRSHQKYFACTDGTGALAPYFAVVANMTTRDGGAQLVAGNERVLRARLSDAEFFWTHDRARRLEARIGKLAERIFHARLGSMFEKVARMGVLAESIAPAVPGLDRELARRAILLAKADLSTGLVGEFPELQGVMGRYLALHDGEDSAVADAVRDHYAPAGLSDTVPVAPVSVVAALADKLDSLAGFFAIDERPTGSKDPYALRRAALGVIRIVIENELRLPLRAVLAHAVTLHAPQLVENGLLRDIGDWTDGRSAAVLDQLMAFFAERLKVSLRERGVRHDLIDAVFAAGEEDDLVRLLARVEALEAFLRSEDGTNLLTAYRRAARIVQIEEKKDGRAYRDTPSAARLRAEEEEALLHRLDDVEPGVGEALAGEDFALAMARLASLRRSVDAFFERVTVNVDDHALRENRLRLLARIRTIFDLVADFSRIEG